MEVVTNMKIFIFLAMMFCHVLDDYTLQSVLASLKQRRWWKGHEPGELYKYDYIIALVMHSISWSFMIMLPIAVYQNFNVGIDYLCVFIGNVFIHAIVDNLKANRRKINLIQDQLIHVCQIIISMIILL